MSAAPARPDVLVAGGGLAGLAAAIGAARRGLAVVLAEGGVVGRDKVCGEFLSPEATVDLRALGGADALEQLDAVPVRSVLLTERRGAELRFEVPGPPGHCVTRAALERWLGDRARAEGVDVLERAPVRALRPSGREVRFDAGDVHGVASALVVALGKRSALDASLDLPRARAPEPFGAAKVYFDAPVSALTADVELHLVPGGYVGLNPVEGGRIGLCALFTGAPPRGWAALRARLEDSGSAPLLRSLARLGEPSGPVRGLYQFGFGAQAIGRRLPGGAPALFAGDAARMMPSFTGDGMAVALRSGRLAAIALGERDPVVAYADSYRRAFRTRIACASVLHHAFLRPSVFRVLAPVLGKTPRLVERLFAWTRGLPAAAAA